jgi:heme exporter protein D
VSAPFLVWLAVGLVTTVAIIAVLIALVRHVMLIGRTAARLQEEVRPIADAISAETDRASSRASRRSSSPPFGRS